MIEENTMPVVCDGINFPHETGFKITSHIHYENLEINCLYDNENRMIFTDIELKSIIIKTNQNTIIRDCDYVFLKSEILSEMDNIVTITHHFTKLL